jgi:hypothetical protein
MRRFKDIRAKQFVIIYFIKKRTYARPNFLQIKVRERRIIMYCHQCGTNISKETEFCEICDAIPIPKMLKSKPQPMVIWIKTILWVLALLFIIIGFIYSFYELFYAGLGVSVTLFAEFLTSREIFRHTYSGANVNIASAAYTIDIVKQQLKQLGDVTDRINIASDEFTKLSVHAEGLTTQATQQLTQLGNQANLRTQVIAEDLKRISSQAQTLIKLISDIQKELQLTSGHGSKFFSVLQMIVSIIGDLASTNFLKEQIQTVIKGIKEIDKKIDELSMSINRKSRQGKKGDSQKISNEKRKKAKILPKSV